MSRVVILLFDELQLLNAHFELLVLLEYFLILDIGKVQDEGQQNCQNG
jgi:hypothetical protein